MSEESMPAGSRPVDRIRRLFEERYAHFDDVGPNYRTREVVERLETHYFTVNDPFDPFGGTCEKHSDDLHPLYLNGAILGFAIELAHRAGSEFTEESVDRARRVKDLYVASPAFIDVKTHLLHGTPDFETLKLKTESLHERFIREMAIEFNQVSEADGYVEAYRSRLSALDEIVEKLKSGYYSTWRNKMDFEWIASLSDYTEQYIVKEYAKLARVHAR